MNRTSFFANIRTSTILFGGMIDQSQVDGISAILDEWDRRKLSDGRWLAYMLATTFHETARTMQPIREYGGPKARYAPYYGRGFVQLTWQVNYRKASVICGVDMVANPDLALLPKNAATILFNGMIDGWFTGKKLANYIDGATCDYVGARAIVNGTDRALLIAGYASAFQKAIEATPQPQMHDQLANPGMPTGPPPKLVQPVPPPPTAAPSGFFNAVAALIKAILAAIFPGK